MSKNVVVITGGDKPEFSSVAPIIQKADVVICADSGGDYAYQNHIMPHYLLGDFDSISAEAKNFFAENQVDIRTVPIEKDFTDTQMALELALQFAPDHLYICGGCGSRIDHSLANILLISQYQSRIPAITLLEKGYVGYYSTGTLEIQGEVGQTVSLLPLTYEVEQVSIRGFYYPLQKGTLEWGSSLGISNILTEPDAYITHDNGVLLVIRYTEKDVD